MMTLTCSLKLSDGRSVSAAISAAAPEDDAPVTWSGETTLVPAHDRVVETSPAVLAVIFRNLARELGAEFSEWTDGEYRTWSE